MLTGSKSSVGLLVEDSRADVGRGGVALEKGEERLLDREFARVADGVDVGVADHLAGRELSLKKAALVGGQSGKAFRCDIGGKRDQQVVGEALTVLVADFLGRHLLDHVAGVAADPAALELPGDDVV